MDYTGFQPQAVDEQAPALSLDALLIRNSSLVFFAMMRGNAMARAGIRHGDLLVIEPAETYRPGQIVLAFVDGQALVRRLDRNVLMAANPECKPVVMDDESVIRGQVVASITLLARPRQPLPSVS